VVAGDEVPEARFASLGEDRIAYQVFGAGNVDLLVTSATGDPIDLRWDLPSYASFLRRLGGGARVIMFDQRGTGASDAPSDETLPSWERWADDARAVLDAVDRERAVIFGWGDGGPTAILFAAGHPRRTGGLILGNTSARFQSGPDYTSGMSEENSRFVQQAWGTRALVETAFPDAAGDAAFVRWAARSQRLSLPPRDASALFGWEWSMDVREALASVRVPTLVLHRDGYSMIPLEQGRYIAEHIPGAQFRIVPGRDGGLYTEPLAESLRHIEEFLAGLRGHIESDRALAAILFTDFVGSTKQLSALGDQAWRNLLDSHDVIARTAVEQHGGHLVRTTGDGILATFDGPGRAIRCATALGDALQPLGVEIRAGLHTGEVEHRGTEIAGIAVHIAARVLEAAAGGELLVSATVPMLVAGSGFEFEDRGEHDLKGVPGTWQLYAVKP
jgi:class 3 adenylate cyclase